MEDKTNLLHNVIMEGRRKLSVSGVEDVDSFDEHEVSLYTNMGAMDIKGRDIHMNKLNLDSEEIVLEGEFDSIIYVEPGSESAKKGFISKIFGG